MGCLIDVRLIGVIDAEQTQNGKTEKNSRLLGAAIHSYAHEDLVTISEVSKTLFAQVEEFFVPYNKQRGMFTFPSTQKLRERWAALLPRLR